VHRSALPLLASQFQRSTRRSAREAAFPCFHVFPDVSQINPKHPISAKLIQHNQLIPNSPAVEH
jgi:hypothetical protein